MIELRALGTLDVRNGEDSAFEALLSGSKRSALLAYLTLARPRGFQRRDRVLALFWPDSGEAQARGSLRNMLHLLRSALGPGVIVGRGRDEIGVAPGSIRCDVLEFERAISAGDHRMALELYRGELLEGLHAPGTAPEFEAWISEERRRLRRMACDAAWALTEENAAAGDATGTHYWGRRAIELMPFDEGAVRRLIELQHRLGDRAGALELYETFAARLAAEWETSPASETRGLIERIRAEGTGTESPTAGPRSPAAPRSFGTGSRLLRKATPRLRRAPLRVRVSVAAAVALMAIAAAVATGPRVPAPAGVVAVGVIEAAGEPDSDLGPTLRSLLVAGLTRSEGLQVIGTERLYELSRPGEGSGSRAGWEDAARRAGAQILVEGVIRRRPEGGHELSLSRRHLDSRQVEKAVTVEGGDPYRLVDRAAALLISDLGIELPRARGVGASTPSPAAFRYYEQGLHHYYSGDNDAAHRMFSSALEEDSTFATAVYFRALTRRGIDQQGYRRDLGRAARLSSRASDRERLLIQSAWAQEMDDPRLLAVAETLAIRYPYVPEGHLFLGRARMWGGDFQGAERHLRQVAGMDSIGAASPSASCRACDARQDLANLFILKDSLPAAETVAREWAGSMPQSARPWHHLARTLEYQGRYDAAREARSRAAALRTDNPRDPVYPAVLALRAGEFEEADRRLRELRAPDASLVQQNVLWYATLSLLYQGRYEEALRSARDYREMVIRAETPAQRRPWESVLEAQVLIEMGRPRDAARLWRAMADYPYEPQSQTRAARHRAWTLTHYATALAAAGDTAALPQLADSIEALGARSSYGRDPRLHHYVRGLLHAARGEPEAAAADYRRAIFSPTSGFGRVNLELGRALLALDRPDEAARVLGAVLRGPLDAGNLYLNRTDVHRMLARAHGGAGRADSASFHSEWVRRAHAAAARDPRSRGF